MERRFLVLVSAVIIAVIALPVSFYAGLTAGYNNGLTAGLGAGANEGSQAIIVQMGTDIILNPGQGFLVTPHIVSSALNVSDLYFNMVAISTHTGTSQFELNLSLGPWLAYSSGYVGQISGNYSFQNLTGNHPLNVWIEASANNTGIISVEFISPMYLKPD